MKKLIKQSNKLGITLKQQLVKQIEQHQLQTGGVQQLPVSKTLLREQPPQQLNNKHELVSIHKLSHRLMKSHKVTNFVHKH